MVILRLELNKEDLEMIKDALGYSRCLYQDSKLERYTDYCDGDECHNCSKPYKIENWIKAKTIIE